VDGAALAMCHFQPFSSFAMFACVCLPMGMRAEVKKQKKQANKWQQLNKPSSAPHTKMGGSGV
jgi:hypothetical protein